MADVAQVAALAIVCVTVVALAGTAAWWHVRRPHDEIDMDLGLGDVANTPSVMPIYYYAAEPIDQEIMVVTIDDFGNVTEIPARKTVH